MSDVYCIIIEDTILYGPTPIHRKSGQTAVFSFDVDAGPSDKIDEITGEVDIYDHSSLKPVKKLIKKFPRGGDGLFHVQLEWAGDTLDGVDAPPGDYGPAFLAFADFTPDMASACSGVSLDPGTDEDEINNASDCALGACAPTWACGTPPGPTDATSAGQTPETCDVNWNVPAPALPGSSGIQRMDFNPTGNFNPGAGSFNLTGGFNPGGGGFNPTGDFDPGAGGFDPTGGFDPGAGGFGSGSSDGNSDSGDGTFLHGAATGHECCSCHQS